MGYFSDRDQRNVVRKRLVGLKDSTIPWSFEIRWKDRTSTATITTSVRPYSCLTVIRDRSNSGGSTVHIIRNFWDMYFRVSKSWSCTSLFNLFSRGCAGSRGLGVMFFVLFVHIGVLIKVVWNTVRIGYSRTHIVVQQLWRKNIY